MDDIEQIKEKYNKIRKDPFTPQYLVQEGQSGSYLDYSEAQEIGEVYCRDGHRHLHYSDLNKYSFCSTCGHRVCPICEEDVGTLWVAWLDHKEKHNL